MTWHLLPWARARVVSNGNFCQSPRHRAEAKPFSQHCLQHCLQAFFAWMGLLAQR